ncbi:MAG: cytochrome c3 family protein [Gammaproteobacteria bacterium]|nr:cytochrome c3 family protein [Gammaproteobacteria bacterium]
MSRMRRRYARSVITPALALTGVLLVMGAAWAPRTGLAWELGAGLGLLSVLALLTLCALPLWQRARWVPALALRPHRWLGWLALALATAHVAVLALADPLVLRYLQPSLPWYQLAGVLCIVLLLAIVLLAEMPPCGWGPGRRGFRPVHIGLCVLALLLLAVHVLVSGRYVAPLAARPGVRAVARELREPVWPGAAGLPLSFPHREHEGISCIACHHNYVDRSGMDTCLGCHRAPLADLRHGAEARLHDFCFDCHRTRPHGAPHGPVAGCLACHHRESG